MAKIELEGRLQQCGDGYECSWLTIDSAELMGILEKSGLVIRAPMKGHTQLRDETLSSDDELVWADEQMDYGRVRITIEQLPRDKSPEAVAKRVVARHRGALDILEEIG